MQALSDIMIMFAQALDDGAMSAAKGHLMQTGVSVLVHQKEGQSRVLLVKFDPRDVTPDALLAALRDEGFDAKMAGG